MKSVKGLIICVLLPAIMATSCIETVTGDGPVVPAERKLNNFSNIALNLSATVRVFKSEENTVTVFTQQNLTDRVITRIDGTTLVITSKGNLVSNSPIQIEVRMREMENFEVNGSGKIVFDQQVVADYIDFSVTGSGSVKADLNVRKVTTVVTGSGTVELSGATRDLSGEVLGSGTIGAHALKADRAKFKLAGSGEVFTYVVNLLDATVTGSGMVHYSGDPELLMSVTGSGKVIRIGSQKK